MRPLIQNDSVGMGSEGHWPAVFGGPPNTSSNYFAPHQTGWEIGWNEVFGGPPKTARGPRALPNQLHRSGLLSLAQLGDGARPPRLRLARGAKVATTSA